MSAENGGSPPPSGNPDFCERRGWHGPFSRTTIYDLHPEWEGMGDCVVCGGTFNVAREQARRRAMGGTFEDPERSPTG